MLRKLTDNAALGDPLIKANAKNIPVVAYDQYIRRGKLDSYLTSDNHQAGFLDGEYIASHFPDDKELKLVLVEYPHVSSTVERVNGFLDALRGYKQPYKIIGTYSAVEPVSGRKAGKKILKDFPAKDSIDVIFTVNDGGGLAVVDELAKAGRTEIVIATIDGDGASVKNIEEGRLTHIDCAQFCGALGRETMKVAYQRLLGKKVPRQVLVPVFPITKKTRHLFKGWNQPTPKKFKKPWHSKTPEWSWEPKVKH